MDLTFKISHEVMLSLLYHEAKFNVIEGRYVLQPEEYDKLAGIQALIHLEHYNANTQSLDKYKYGLPSGCNWNFISVLKKFCPLNSDLCF